MRMQSNKTKQNMILMRLWKIFSLVMSIAGKILIIYVYCSYLKYRPALNSYLYCSSESSECVWHFYHHDFILSYLVMLSIFNYIAATFTSPGRVEVVPTNSVAESFSCYMTSMYGTPQPPPSPDQISTDASSKEFNLKKATEEMDIACITTRNVMSPVMGPVMDDVPGQQPLGSGIVNHRTSTAYTWTLCNRCYPQRLRPNRAHHCSTCNACILRFDHHCPYINNCVGLNNYRYYFLTVLYVNIGILYGIYMSLSIYFEAISVRYQLYQEAQLRYLWNVFVDLPWNNVGAFSQDSTGVVNDDSDTVFQLHSIAIFVFPVLVLLLPPLSILLWSHISLIRRGMTTCEDIIKKRRCEQQRKWKQKQLLRELSAVTRENSHDDAHKDAEHGEITEKCSPAKSHNGSTTTISNPVFYIRQLPWKKMMGMLISGTTGLILLRGIHFAIRIYSRGLRLSQDLGDIVFLGSSLLVYMLLYNIYRASRSPQTPNQIILALQMEQRKQKKQSQQSMDDKCNKSNVNKSTPNKLFSPYDKGSFLENFKEVVGQRIFLCFIPMRIKMPPPVKVNINYHYNMDKND